MTILDLPDGLHFNVPADEYHRRIIGVASKSALDRLAKSPLHYHAWVTGQAPDEESEALAFGRAFHCAVLEPDVFERTYVVEPDFGDKRSKENKERWKAWQADNAAKNVVSAAEWQAIRGMTASLRAHPLAAKMLVGGESEVTALWTDKETGLRCRTRADYWKRDRRLIVDLKSAADASPEAFTKVIFNRSYERQHALYREGFAAVGCPAEHFVYVVVEKTPPFAVGLYQLDADGVAIGHTTIRESLDELRKCLETDTWPGYSQSIVTIETPRWAA